MPVFFITGTRHAYSENDLLHLSSATVSAATFYGTSRDSLTVKLRYKRSALARSEHAHWLVSGPENGGGNSGWGGRKLASAHVRNETRVSKKRVLLNVNMLSASNERIG